MKTLQDLSIDPNTFNSAIDLPIFSAPELVKFEYQDVIPDQILRSLAMYSTKLREVSFPVPHRTDDQAVYFPLRGLEKVCIGEPSDEFIEILCRNNRDLQSIELLDGRRLTAVFMTHLATLEHLTNIRICNNQSDRFRTLTFMFNNQHDWFCTPTSLLSFLRNRASRPKNLELFVSDIDCKDPQEILDLKQEIERQKLEDSSSISVGYTDLNGRQVYV